jgi:hypothetical protein
MANPNPKTADAPPPNDDPADAAPPPNDDGIPQTGLISASFSLEFIQGYPDPVTQTPVSKFTLRVIDTKGIFYQRSLASIPNQVALVCSLLKRIADKQAKPGWTFDATYYPSQNAGTITG